MCFIPYHWHLDPPISRPRYRVEKYPGKPQAPFDICFAPEAFDVLLRTVGARPAESGAKGFGPVDLIGFDRVEFDVTGSNGAKDTIYSPDAAWGNERCEHHRSMPGSEMRLWTGDIHSHPENVGVPSGRSGKGLGDLGYVEEVFEENETMQWFLMPILTQAATREVIIHPWVCRRDGLLMTSGVRICNIDQFPAREFNPEWERSLVAPASSSVLATQCDEQTPTVRTSSATSERLLAAYTKRDGSLSPAFHTKTVLFVGVGAGSYLVEKMARLSPKTVKLVDFDTVDEVNLGRTSYTLSDAQDRKLKVDAMAEHVARINPLVSVEVFPHSITDLGTAEVDRVFEEVDLVVAGTDNFEAQSLINEVAMRKGIAAVFIGIHANAHGGRIVWTVPGHSPCYRCMSPERYEAAHEPNSTVLDLDAAHGSLVDCQFIDMVAFKVATAVLERNQESTMGRFFRRMEGRNEICVRCDPEYGWGNDLTNALLSDLPTEPKNYASELQKHVLFAMDTVWLPGARDPNCPVCGPIKCLSGG